MKLSNFSYPFNGMEQIDIDPKNVDEVVDKLYEKLENDSMDYNLKLFSPKLLMSNDFSDQFTNEQYYNKRAKIFRIHGGHKPISYYKGLVKKNLLKVSTGQKIEIEDGGDLNKKIYNKMMK